MPRLASVESVADAGDSPHDRGHSRRSRQLATVPGPGDALEVFLWTAAPNRLL